MFFTPYVSFEKTLFEKTLTLQAVIFEGSVKAIDQNQALDRPGEWSLAHAHPGGGGRLAIWSNAARASSVMR